MANLTIRNMNDEAKERLKERAKRNGRSQEAEARAILDRELRPMSPAEWLEDLKDLKRRSPIKLPPGIDSVSLIREERDRW